LGDVAKIAHGWPFKSESFSEELTGRPIVVNIGNFRYTGGFRFDSTTLKEYRGEYPPGYELAPGDILLVMTCQTAGGEILGVPGRIPDDGRVYLHNQRLGKVVLSDPSLIDSSYLYWLFLWPCFNRELYLTASGTKILHTSPSRIEDFRFALPPLPEQRAIADILGTLDDKIELNRRMDETLEAMARAVFKSWFVDFDPVHAKAKGRQPLGMDAESAALFPDSFQDSLLGKIPKGWRACAVGEVIEVGGGTTPSTKEPAYWDGQVHWATPKDLSFLHSSVLLDTERKITQAGLEQIGSRVYPRGTVLLSSRAPIGYVATSEVPVAVNQGVIAMVCGTNPSNHYMLQWARNNMDLIESRASGTTFQEISKGNFRSIPILLPTNGVMSVFTETIEPVHRRMVNNLRESGTLGTIRDALLPKLISGELRVKEADRTAARP
jgi:type I restriction enzyme S subunit